VAGLIGITGLPGQIVIRSQCIALRLRGDGIFRMDNSGRRHDARRESGDCHVWTHAEVTVQDRQARIRYSAATQHGKAASRAHICTARGMGPAHADANED
jgi:hypothetical protein